ncbi:class I mannose-6-phosphate isomerase [Bradyrhizobium sp.]|jgi:mannose-6-phosphate isomerase|uniref:class I mannose-6-phosphate isomerase n=1 Tax=Bradyrhizobium sp. TaxID=376 RepID=UPI002DF8D111|nr:class I mannose-6-phosphate isomerase [Bradyrhizobium sp.]
MAIEHAAVQVVRKPWGVADLRPWSSIDGSGEAIGELWFQRADKNAPIPALLLKLLFTSEPLSIQVHPDDAFARSIGLPNGKTEAWYILSATPDARIAVGLKRHLTPQQLRASIKDGSIAGLAQWRPARRGDVIFIPAGTIHAIGSGIMLAEIQQHSDATFRLFDHGRQRELHEDSAVAVSDAGPAQTQAVARRLSDERWTLIASPHFVLERFNLPANSTWALTADKETWMLAIEGLAKIGATNTTVGDVIFVEGDRAIIEVGPDGISGLIAYPGPDPIISLLQEAGEQMTKSVVPSAQRPTKSNEVVEAQT